MIRILKTDSIKEIASKIFYGFEMHQSCSVDGCTDIEGTLFTNGELVLEELRKLDIAENTEMGGKKIRRKRVILPKSVGGFVAQKIFRFDERDYMGTIRVTIWRIQ